MTDDQWVEFIRGMGDTLDERIEIIEDFMAYGYANSMPVVEWLALSEIYKILREERTRLRVEAIRKEVPFSELIA